MGKIKGYFILKWHRYFMKYHISHYEACVDPIKKGKLYEKASFHANKVLRG